MDKYDIGGYSIYMDFDFLLKTNAIISRQRWDNTCIKYWAALGIIHS